MLEALMIVAGFITAPMNPYANKQVIYVTTPYENIEICQGHLLERGEEIALLIMRGKIPIFTFSEDGTTLVLKTRDEDSVTLTCKEL